MSDQFRIEWVDAGLEPECEPDPRYPQGIDLDLVKDPQLPSCSTALPYPARRIGMFMIQCRFCQIAVGCTTAGRPDDPRSIKFNCLP